MKRQRNRRNLDRVVGWFHLPRAFAKLDKIASDWKCRSGIFRVLEGKSEIADEIMLCVGDLVQLKHDLLPQTSAEMKKFAANTKLTGQQKPEKGMAL